MAFGVVFTKMQRRVVNKLQHTYYGRLKLYYERWKAMAFSKFNEFLESKKARIIDKLVYATMSGEKKSLMKWYKQM